MATTSGGWWHEQALYKDTFGKLGSVPGFPGFLITYTWDEASQTIKGDLSGTVSIFADKLAADREQGKAEITAFVTNLTCWEMGDVSGFLDEEKRRAA